MTIINQALEMIGNIGLYEYKRWRESKNLQSQILHEQVEQAMQKGNPDAILAIASSLEDAGLTPDAISGLVTGAQAFGLNENIKEIRKMRVAQPEGVTKMGGRIATPTVDMPIYKTAAERTSEQRKATLTGELEYQQENLPEILDIEIQSMKAKFPTILEQKRQLLKLQSQVESEIGTGKVQNVTIYDEAQNQREISIPQTVASNPKMREAWITKNYPGWNEIKVKDKQLEDLKMSAWNVAMQDPSQLTPAQKQLIGWEDRPNLSKALTIAGRDPTFGLLPVEQRMKQVLALAEVLDGLEKYNIDIFQAYPDARFDPKAGKFYTMQDGQKFWIELNE